MIKLKSILLESNEKYRKDWLKRYEANFTPDDRLIAYHGTTLRNSKLIKQTGFKENSYFSLKPEYSKSITSIYHDIPENKVVVFKVYLPLNSVEFVSSDIFSIRPIKYTETI